MSITLDLPPQLTEEFQTGSLAPTDQATLILHLAAALLAEEPATLFQGAVKEFLASRSIDSLRIASVLDELVAFCAGEREKEDGSTPVEGDRTKRIELVLRGWRDAVVRRLSPEMSIEENCDLLIKELPPPGQMTQALGRSPRISALGKYAHLPISSEAFAREKQEEIDQEERRRR